MSAQKVAALTGIFDALFVASYLPAQSGSSKASSVESRGSADDPAAIMHPQKLK